jgi:IS1 family transposase
LVQKNYCWIWIGVDRYEKIFINFIIGDRSNKTAEAFWGAIKQHEMEYIASDYWKPYAYIIPRENTFKRKPKHLLLKDKTVYSDIFRQ